MTTYAIAGASARCLDMFAKPLKKDFSEYAKVVGVFDINQTRARKIAEVFEGENVPVYHEFEQMLHETHPDKVIVTTMDAVHGKYIVQALRAGCDVISEKPICNTQADCDAILAAEKETGRSVTVTFNCRFMPLYQKVKEMLQEGVVGRVLNVNFEYLLDRSHGADYFRRWHRRLENSYSLLVHKATHHLDIINWWMDDTPIKVSALGSLQVYGAASGREYAERCRTCRNAKSCRNFVDLEQDPVLKALYLDAEHEDGYWRDGCIFSPEIDIPDTMSVNVEYANHSIATYSLITYSPYEGWRVSITGTKGRLETSEFYTGPLAEGDDYQISFFDLEKKQTNFTVSKMAGTHGGGDEKLRQMLFAGAAEDPLHAMASAEDGIVSARVGIAAMDSILTDKTVRLK